MYDFSFYFHQLLSLHSLDIDLNDWLLVKDGFLSDDLDRALDLNWNLDSLLHGHNIFDMNDSINKPVNINLDWMFLNNFNYLLHNDFRI